MPFFPLSTAIKNIFFLASLPMTLSILTSSPTVHPKSGSEWSLQLCLFPKGTLSSNSWNSSSYVTCHSWHVKLSLNANNEQACVTHCCISIRQKHLWKIWPLFCSQLSCIQYCPSVFNLGQDLGRLSPVSQAASTLWKLGWKKPTCPSSFCWHNINSLSEYNNPVLLHLHKKLRSRIQMLLKQSKSLKVIWAQILLFYTGYTYHWFHKKHAKRIRKNWAKLGLRLPRL